LRRPSLDQQGALNAPTGGASRQANAKEEINEINEINAATRG
jgi:hypothetical protein